MIPIPRWLFLLLALGVSALAGTREIRWPAAGTPVVVVQFGKLPAGVPPGSEADLDSCHTLTCVRNGVEWTFRHAGHLDSHGSLAQGLLDGLVSSGRFESMSAASEYTGEPDWRRRWDAASWNDSELLFHFLLATIDEADGDVFKGLYNALNETDCFGFNVKAAITAGDEDPANLINFVLSNGQALYIYRNAADANLDCRISWQVYKTFRTGLHTVSGQRISKVRQYELVRIPRQGSVARFTDMYTHEGGVVESRRYHPGTNWVCFPVLPISRGPISARFLSTLCDGHITASMFLENETRSPDTWDGVQWMLGDNGDMLSTKGYKLSILEGNYTTYHHLMAGAERISPTTLLHLHPGWNDVPYFVEQSQHPSEAFPQAVLDVMGSINGEYWFMIRRDGEFVVKRLCGPMIKGFECYTLQYGAMYQVHVTQPISFQWNQPASEPIDSFEPPVLVHFLAEKQPDYIPVVVEGIEGDTGIAEIGAMQNGVCVGAEVVDGYPINLQVYTDDLSTVQFVYADADGLLLPAGQGETVAGAGKRLAVQTYERTQSGAAVITLARGIGDADQPTDFRILSAHPNPFNPTTTLRILLPEAGVIRLEIYNLAGQMVATLVDGHLQAGVHELGWNGQVDDGTAAASGIYYGVLSHGSERSTVKLLLVK